MQEIALAALCFGAGALLLLGGARRRARRQEAPPASVDRPPSIRVPRASSRPTLQGVDTQWDLCTPIRITCYHQASGAHRPAVSVQALYDDENIYVRFVVWDDVSVVGRFLAPNSPVYTDSCVELFLQLAPALYVNVEMNCLGAVLLGRHVMPREGTEVDPALFDDEIERWSSAREDIGRVRRDEGPPFTWHANVRIPFALLARLAAPHPDDPTPPAGAYPIASAAGICSERPFAPPVRRGDTLRGGFFKCADDSSQPHWGAWADLGPELNFHQPHRFGMLVFD